MFGSSPQFMTCPHCNATMSTNVEKEVPTSVHVAACLLCIVFFPLAWLPYYMNERKANHYCSECNAQLGATVPPDTLCYSHNDPSCCIPIFDCCSCNCGPNHDYNETDAVPQRVVSHNDSEPSGCFPCVDCGDCGGCDYECGDCGGCECGDCGGCDCDL
ncbi:hypothetical protein ACKWTF_014003 [Chironomus riparius]